MESGIFREVMDSEKDGRLVYVTTTGYLEAAQTLVTGGRHVLVVEDLTGRVIMADYFSLTGSPAVSPLLLLCYRVYLHYTILS